eukprot:6474869-Amphidinium_carterae.1
MATTSASVPQPERPHAFGPRGSMTSAAAGCKMDGGRIHYHHSKQSFEAICNRHAGCTLTRTHKARKRLNKNGFPQGGRPLGFLAAWLELHCESKLEHRDLPTLANLSHEQRSACRDALAMAEGGAELLRFEREKLPEEPEEPLLLDGYL